jgi:glycosyltransferase involved in cell wall biosynthesis
MSYNTIVTKSNARPSIGLMATLLSTAANYRGAGIHQYSKALLAHLPQQAPQFNFRAFVMDRTYAAPAGVAASCPRWLPAHPPARIAWEQIFVARASKQLHLLHGFAYALPLLSHVPAVVTVHDLTFMRFPQAFPRNKQRYLAGMTAKSCQRAQVVIADSQATADDLQHYLHVPQPKIQVIYTGVSPRYQPLPPQQVEARRQQEGWPSQFMLMVGTLEPRKNHLGLIEAYARYRAQARHPLPLLIGGGKGWHFAQIFQRVQELDLENHIHFLGFVPWESLPWLYNAATLFVYPSLYEGFGLPVAEAMRCGTPVITSNVSSLPEVAGDAALTVAPKDADALAAAMLTLLETDTQQLETMKTLGLTQAAQFSWTRTATQTAQVYSRILNQTHG